MATFMYVSVFLSCLMLCFCSMTCTSADDTVYRELLARIEALETQGQEQAELLMTQTATIQEMELKLDIQNVKISHQQQAMEHYKKRIETLEQTIEEMKTKSRIDVPQETVNEIKDDIVKTEQANVAIHKVNARHRRLVLDDGIVAFHAVIKTNEKHHIGVGNKIVYPVVMTNLGGGYHSNTGIFTAPQAGVYLFSTSILSYDVGHDEIYVHLMKNGNILANVYAHGESSHNDQGSVTVVTQLAVGDNVWISLYGPSDASLWGEYYDNFMGCLIIPM